MLVAPQIRGVERRRLEHQSDLDKLVASKNARSDALAGFEAPEPALEIAAIDLEAIHGEQHVAGVEARTLRRPAVVHGRKLEPGLAVAIGAPEREGLAVRRSRRAALVVGTDGGAKLELDRNLREQFLQRQIFRSANRSRKEIPKLCAAELNCKRLEALLRQADA